MNKPVSARRAARMLIVQGLYAWLLSEQKIQDLEDELLASHYLEVFTSLAPEDVNQFPVIRHVDTLYFRQVFHGIFKHFGALKEIFTPKLDRNIEQLGSVEMAILLLATYELQYTPHTPYKVVLNEAIDLAKVFGAQDSHKFINGVLDQLVYEQKSAELAKTAE